MAHKVDLAFIGDPAAGLHRGHDYEHHRLHYDDLPKVQIDVEDTDTLRHVILRGCLAAAMPSAEQYVARWQGISFKNSSYELGRSPEVYAPTVLDSLGRAKWNAPIGEVSVRELLAAEHAGALEGEALKLCVALDSEYGNGPLTDWSDYLLALVVLWEVMKGVDTLHGFAEGMKAVAAAVSQRLRRGQEVAQDAHHDWKSRGGFPTEVQALVFRHAWDANALGVLLGTDANGAEGVLWSHGFEHDEQTGLWYPPSGHDFGALLHVIQTYAAGYDAGYEAARADITQQVMALLEEYARSGRVERPPWQL